MKLSIIIPFHKYSQFLEDALESVAVSGLEDFETILVLDHCQEEIAPLVEQYKEEARLRTLLLEEKTGVSAARNAGLKEAQGEYVYFLDSDDYVMEDALVSMLSQAEKTEADVVYGRKRYSWFKRKVYSNSKEERREQDDLRELTDDGGEGRKDLMKDPASFGGSEKERAAYALLEVKHGIHGISVLHMMIRKSLLEKQQILFDESSAMYGDLSFVMQLLEKGEQFNYAPGAIYVKRRHNDPVTMPAISDINKKERLVDLLSSYNRAKEMLEQKESYGAKVLDEKLIYTLAGGYATYIKDARDSQWLEDSLAQWAKSLRLVSPVVLDKMPGYQKKMAAAVAKQDVKKAVKVAKNRSMLRQIKGMVSSKAAAGKFLYRNIFSKLPLKKDYVVFETFMGKNYSDSPKYIYEYLAKHNQKNFKFVWVLNNGTKPPYGAKVIKRMSLRYLYYMAVSKYFVFNVRQPQWFTKREGQIFLETWHGTPLKRLVFDQEEVTSASPTYKIEFYRQREDWDYLIAANPFSTKTFRSCFKFEKEMLEVGYPRNDLMYHPDKEMIALGLKKKMGIPLDKKTILYAPTWRDDEYYKPGQYKFTLQLNLKKMKEALGDEYVVLLRTHHYIADNLDVSGVEDFAINLSKYDDITEIYLVSDICITDYSSVFFDYANLKRPILFYTYDIEKYRDDLRGFYIDMNTEVPGPLLYSTEEVVDAIQHIESVNEKYKETYEQFYERFCGVDDGNASKRTVERVFS